jgi:hypothetical protein
LECRNALYSPAFFVFWKGVAMLVRYKRNKQTACYDSNNLSTRRQDTTGLNGLAVRSKAAATAHTRPTASSATALREIALERICKKLQNAERKVQDETWKPN